MSLGSPPATYLARWSCFHLPNNFDESANVFGCLFTLLCSVSYRYCLLLFAELCCFCFWGLKWAFLRVANQSIEGVAHLTRLLVLFAFVCVMVIMCLLLDWRHLDGCFSGNSNSTSIWLRPQLQWRWQSFMLFSSCKIMCVGSCSARCATQSL